MLTQTHIKPGLYHVILKVKQKRKKTVLYTAQSFSTNSVHIFNICIGMDVNVRRVKRFDFFVEKKVIALERQE